MVILNLIRIKDWLKNILIFFPLIFSGLVFDAYFYPSLILGFITFCVVSSSIYILNDILDIDSDKLHPLKKHSKPLANNSVTIGYAYITLLVFSIISIFLLYFQPQLYISISLYLLISFGYNFGFKKFHM